MGVGSNRGNGGYWNTDGGHAHAGACGRARVPRAARLGEKSLGLFREGLAEGVPIALGYFAVSFSLGIAAKMSGLTLSQGVVTSFCATRPPASTPASPWSRQTPATLSSRS
jgi:hypothetical protein